MEKMNSVTVKIHLVDDNFKTLEIQKLEIPYATLRDYKLLTDKVGKMFPELSKNFKIYWTDSENDKVAIFLQEGLETALQEQSSSKIKSFYVKAVNPTKQIDEREVEVDAIHPNIFCDGCNGNVVGYRYKCLTCRDFDLCSECEQANLHPEHPMIRIAFPLMFNQINLMKLMRHCSYEKFESKHSHHRRKHCHDHSASHKKKRYEKCESGMETGEESDENLQKKLSNVRSCAQQNALDAAMKIMNCKNHPKSSGGSLINDILKTVLIEDSRETSKPGAQEETKEEKKEELPHVNDFKSVVKTFVSILKPLGIDVNVEVRPGYEEEASPSKQAEEKKEKKQEQAQTSTTSPSTPSPAPVEKDVRFATPELQNNVEKEVEKITKILANQTMSQLPENDGWGFFEELEKSSEEPRPSTSAEGNSKDLNTEEQTMQAENPKETSNIYPSLKNGQSQNAEVANALKQMLAMGFTNDGGWLTHLLEAKNGDINQALEVLAPHKK